MIASLNNISFGYDDKIILKDVSALINEGDRIGLLGKNGVGKSTLINVLLGNLRPDEGDVFLKKGLSIGFLAQDSGLDSSLSVYEEMKGVFKEAYDIFDELRSIETELSILDPESKEYEEKLKRYNYLNHRYENMDGYNIDVRIKQVLNGMGFMGRYDECINHMSGGEKTRLALTKLLLLSPELLILDEPTNHLDFSTLLFLEDYLKTFKGSLLVVSHDRYFLDKVINRVWELSISGFSTYNNCNYTKYRVLRQERIDLQLKEYNKQQVEIQHLNEFIERFRYKATKARSAQDRIKKLENMDIIEKPVLYEKEPFFNFEFDRESNKYVLYVENHDVSIGGKELIKNVNFTVENKDRIGIIGNNGAGKSTFIKEIIRAYNEVVPGVRYGVNVTISSFDQEGLNLHMDNTVLYELWDLSYKRSQTEVRKILSYMLFTSDDMDKKVEVLSGGEKAKLSFALMISNRANTLILDEPTNHIDLPTREALEKGLKEFKGTVIFVSHDRYFLNAVANKIVDFNNGTSKVYEGNFDSYLSKKVNTEPVKETKIEKVKKPTKQEKKNEINKKARIKELELKVESLEKEKQQLEQDMITFAHDYQKINEINGRYNEVNEKINKLTKEWEEII